MNVTYANATYKPILTVFRSFISAYTCSFMCKDNALKKIRKQNVFIQMKKVFIESYGNEQKYS